MQCSKLNFFQSLFGDLKYIVIIIKWSSDINIGCHLKKLIIKNNKTCLVQYHMKGFTIDHIDCWCVLPPKTQVCLRLHSGFLH